MDYPETLSYLYSRLPMFTRDGSSAYRADLGNILELCSLLGEPQHKFRSIHVGGTNGKGSTSHMLAAILQTAGYKTGLYTSPHLRDFRERIRINGAMIPEQEVVDFVEAHRSDFERIAPSFFEVTVALAFDHFAKQQVDIAVIEVGLGGRLDSTNIIYPLLSVITNIGLDHTNILGDSLQKIAVEKAGIIKSGIPVVIGQRQEEIQQIFISKAAEAGSKIVFASDEWTVERLKEEGFKAEDGESSKSEVKSQKPEKIQNSNLKSQKSEAEAERLMKTPNSKLQTPNSELLPLIVLPTCQPANLQPSTSPTLYLDLTGTYQQKNLATVLSSVEQLRKQGFRILDEHIQTALTQVKNLTGLMGRWQTLSTNPLVICDTGHNEDGIREVLKNIANVRYQKLHMVIGMVKDKDISNVLKLLPTNARYYFCQPDIPRAKAAAELAAEANALGLQGEAYLSVQLALDAAKSLASPSDLIFVGGSTFVVAEVV